MLFFDLLRKKLGYHVCEEFTRWELKEEEGRSTPIINGVPIHSLASPCVIRTQSRQCTICGKLYIRNVKSEI